MRWVWAAAGVVVLVGASIVAFVYMKSAPMSAPGQTVASSATPELTNTYINQRYGFGLMMPTDYSAREAYDQASSTDSVTLQNSADEGIQIIISPFDEDTGGGYTLTKDRILQDVPDLSIENEQPVIVGTKYQGLAFKSDSLAFDGDSREVWFVYKGNLYQISTYARLDPLLQAIFKTWQFN